MAIQMDFVDRVYLFKIETSLSDSAKETFVEELMISCAAQPLYLEFRPMPPMRPSKLQDLWHKTWPQL